MNVKPPQLRNFCVLGHIDHGKSSLVDWLIAENGVIPSRLAGQLRYLDDLPDEQARGITMRASAISILYDHKGPKKWDADDDRFLVTVVDSPGHIDFGYDAGAAARATDGAVIVVDVMEGVRAQTLSALRAAHQEGLAVLLVLNKIDRLCAAETMMDPPEAFERLRQIIEQVNAVHNIFAPETGNVVFASAKLGIAFSLAQISRFIAPQFKIDKKLLGAQLFNSDVAFEGQKFVKRQGKHAHADPIFSTLVLEPLFSALSSSSSEWNVFLGGDAAENKDAVIRERFPLARAVLKAVVDTVPPPALSKRRRFFQRRPRRRKNTTDETKACLVAKFFALQQQRTSSIIRDSDVLALTRVVDGTLRKGDRLTVILEDDDESEAQVVIQDMYAMMGSSVVDIDEAGPGRVIALGPEIARAAKGHKRVSLCSNEIRTPRAPLAMQPPLLVVAVESKDRSDDEALDHGLALLSQLDAAAKVEYAANGERRVCAVGELHLDQCLKDLRERYANVDMDVSPPVVGFYEGIAAIETDDWAPRQLETPPWNELTDDLVVTPAGPKRKRATASLEKDAVSITISVAPIDDVDLVKRLFARKKKFSGRDDDDDDSSDDDDDDAPQRNETTVLSKAVERYLAAGVTVLGLGPPNTACALVTFLKDVDAADVAAVRAGFALAAESGPLAEEPVHGVMYYLDAVTSSLEDPGALISAAKKCCRGAHLASPVRVLEPAFLCDLRCANQHHVGKMFALVNKRRGRVVSEDVCPTTGDFVASVLLPASQAIGFPNALLEWTSGAATAPSMTFHNDLLPLGSGDGESFDPFWRPTTLDEREEFGDAGSQTVGKDNDVLANAPRKLMTNVRQRKGLPVERRLTQASAEARSSNARIRG